MRKTSQDGGDSSSITSGIENDIKKPGALMKTKRTSIKRKVQSLSHESDDTVIEPLLQKDKERSETSNQSAKYNLLSKTKTEFKSEKENDKEKLLQNETTQNSEARNVDDTIISIPCSNMLPKSSGVTAPLHNHMNTNVFSSHDALKGLITPKSHILVEIDGSKQSGYSPSPLIFTTAKIHTDGKTKHMEPLQVTPVPILSTIEVSVPKGTSTASGGTTGAVTSNISTIYTNISKHNTNMLDKDLKLKTLAPTITSAPGNGIVDSKALSSTDKTYISNGVPTKGMKDQKNESTTTIPNNAKDNKYINSETKKEKDVKQTKMSLSQPISGPSSQKPKTALSNDFKKPVIESFDTKASAASYTAKNITSDKFDQTAKSHKFDINMSSTEKTDLNKNVKDLNRRESSHTGTLDNKSDATSRDNSLAKTSSTKQLQRQKVAIDKDDSISKLKLSTDSTTLDESEIIKTRDDIATTVTKSVTDTKSLLNDVNRFGEKSKLPNSTANDVQIANSIPNNSNKSHIITTLSNTVNRSTTSNSFTSAKPTVTAHNTTQGAVPSSSQQSDPKPLSSNIITTASSNKSTHSATSSKPLATTVSSTSALSAVPSVKTENVSTVGNLPITSQSISNAKLPVKQASPITTHSAVIKAAPESIVNKSKESTTKNSAAASSTTKISSVPISVAKTSGSITAAKIPSITTDATKISSGGATATKTSSTLTSSVRTPSVSSTTAKTSSISTNIPKTTSVPTNTGKTTVSTSAVKAPSVSTSIVKTTTVNTSVAKSPSVFTSIAKTPVSTSAIKTSTAVSGPEKAPLSTATPVTTVKSSSVSTSTAKSSASKIDTTPISKISVSPPATKSTITTTSKVVDSTTKSIESNKKSEDLSKSNKSSKA